MATPPTADRARAARDYLTDLTDLLGIASPRPCPPGVQLTLSAAETHRLADLLLSGVLARQMRLTPDAAVWCTRYDGVGAVVRIARHEVTLRSVASGQRWDAQLSEIRPATLAEIRAADLPSAGGRREAQAPAV